MSPTRRLLSYLAPYRLRAAVALACMVVLALTTAIYAFLVGPLLAFLATGDYKAALPPSLQAILPGISLETIDREALLTWLPLLLLSISLVKGASYAGQFFLTGAIGQGVVADLRRELFAKLVSMPPSFYATRHTGDLHSRLSVDVQHVENAIVHGLSSYVRDTMQVTVLLVQAFLLDWRLSLIAFGAVPVTVYPVVLFAKWLKRITTTGNETMGRLSRVAHETISAIRIVQAFGAEEREKQRYAGALDEYVHTMKRSLLVRGLSSPTMELIAVGGLGAAIAYAGGSVAAGELDGRTFISFVATVMLLYQPAKSMGRMGNFLMLGLAGAERMFEIIDLPVEIRDRAGARPLPTIRDSITFENVTLAYDATGEGPARPVLDGLDLTVKRGEVVAIVGPSGSGKTSLLNVVARFYEPTGGRVCIDGHDLRDVTLASLRGQMALVTQETFLFNETLAENIAYGRPSATRAQIEEAAKAAGAHGFISALPAGYETRVGEKGVTLSGGQRQRIAIARALLKDAPMLVLDEATSALDAQSEADVQAALDRLMKDRTVLIVAHRLSTVRNADRIVVLVNGKIVEQGSHDALLARNGHYARLHALTPATEAQVA